MWAPAAMASPPATTGLYTKPCASRVARRHLSPSPARSACQSMPGCRCPSPVSAAGRCAGGRCGAAMSIPPIHRCAALQPAPAWCAPADRHRPARAGRDLYVEHRPQWGAKAATTAPRLERALQKAARPCPGPGPCPQRLSINPDLPMPLSCVCSREAVRDSTV